MEVRVRGSAARLTSLTLALSVRPFTLQRINREKLLSNEFYILLPV